MSNKPILAMRSAIIKWTQTHRGTTWKKINLTNISKLLQTCSYNFKRCIMGITIERVKVNIDSTANPITSF